MWMAGCLPQSFVTVLKFTYLFVISFFLLRAVPHAVVREQLGRLSSCLPFFGLGDQLTAEVLTVTLSCLPGSGSGPHAGVAVLN